MPNVLMYCGESDIVNTVRPARRGENWKLILAVCSDGADACVLF